MAAPTTRSVRNAHAGHSSEAITPLLVTVPEAAHILSIGRTAVYQLVWDGELTPIHIGRSVRFSVDELSEFVARRVSQAVTVRRSA